MAHLSGSDAVRIDGAGVSPAFLTKADLVYDRLKGWILSGQLAPGHPLTQEELAADLGLDVSRMPLREAIARLSSEGLVESRPHRTAKVSELSMAEMRDIYAARESLESMLAAQSAPLCDDEVIDAMAEILEEQEQALRSEDYETAVRLDRRFHATLYSLSGFQHSQRMVLQLRDVSDRYVRVYATTNDLAVEGFEQHRLLLKACRDRDPALVRRLTAEHVRAGVIGLSAAQRV